MQANLAFRQGLTYNAEYIPVIFHDARKHPLWMLLYWRGELSPALQGNVNIALQLELFWVQDRLCT
ncbi:hypothetical protein ED28_16405 [[Pantoea] beijingensis]|uniref:Uncharacterized protein n=1 Tax=[Pantoea] beijingensis TaxID=1324864 RepID=A0A443IAA5_9GAMM|nr:hypothetical protein ED28_16405 [[Pantoea] beijingensis]